MLEFLIDSIFVIFGGRVFQQTVDIPMGTNCSALLADLFLYSYEEYFIQGLLKKNEKKVARSFNFTFRYVDDVLSLNNSRFGDFVYRIFPIELEIKDTTDTDRSASCLYMPLPTPRNWQVKNETLRQKRWFQFPIVNFSFICSNIPAAPVYEVYVSQLIWYSRTCGSYQDFLHRGLLLIRKLRNQVEVITSKVLRLPPRLGWPLWNICVTTDHGYVPLVGKHFLVLSSFMTYHRVCN